MKRQWLVGAVAALMLTLVTGGMALATEAKTEVKRTAVKKERVVTVTARVEAIDLNTRVVTLKGSGGKIFDVKVGPEARNLAQVKVGDTVTVKYYESIAYRLQKPGEAAVAPQQAAMAERSKPGEKPAGVVAEETTATATIEAIDMKAQTATLKGPNGKSFTVKAKDPKNLASVKVGDKVVITYTEAVALSVTPKP